MKRFLFVLIIALATGVHGAGRDDRVNAISYRLQTQGVSLCKTAAPQASFYLHGDHSRVVDTVIPGSPAMQAGLKVGDVIASVADTPADDAHIADLLDAAFAQGTVDLRLIDGRHIFFPAEPGCGFSISIEKGKSLDAWADGHAVSLTPAMVDFAQDDDELALIIAHELSHNILNHHAQLDAHHVHHGLLATFTSSARLIRHTEEEADVEALYLMALAGYDYNKAPAFWKRFGDKTGAGLFSDGTHPRTRARADLAEATVAQIHAQLVAGKKPQPPEPLLPTPPSQDQKSR